MFDRLVYSCGILFIGMIFYIFIIALSMYIGNIIKKQTKIKWLCKHEYEPCSAFYCGGVEYDFRCRKCGKVISVKTVTDDKFDWIEKE